jgi:hypothetical protein
LSAAVSLSRSITEIDKLKYNKRRTWLKTPSNCRHINEQTAGAPQKTLLSHHLPAIIEPQGAHQKEFSI